MLSAVTFLLPPRGAVGDVDGDGRLDVLVNVVSVGVIRDAHARFVKMKFDTDIYKVTKD